MKISCTKSNLLSGINIAMRAVPSKTTLPILESFLIEAFDEIKITTNDNDMGIETIVEGNVVETGKIAIEARIFSEIIRKLPENEILIEADASYKVRITCEDSQFNLNGRNPDEFPELVKTDDTNKITMSQFTLKELIRQTIFSIAPNDNNALMRGELFEITDSTVKVVSLDGHRISIRKEELADRYDNKKVIVPGKTLMEISRILGGEKADPVDIIFDNKFVKFVFDSTIVISRLIEGEYYDVDRMISTDYETEVKINKNDFLNCIDRALTLSREGEKRPIILNITENDINIDITSSLGSMNAHLPIIKQGKNLEIGFNPRFFMDALKVIDDEEINIYFVNSNAPCFIRNREGEYIYIILPINIKR